jgi:hypothetical protein
MEIKNSMAQKRYVYLSKAALIAVAALSVCIIITPKAWAQG